MSADRTRGAPRRGRARAALLLLALLGIMGVGSGAALAGWKSLPGSTKDKVRGLSWVRTILYAVHGPGSYPRTGRELGDGGAARDAILWDPAAIWVDGEGSVHITDRRHARIRVVTADTMWTLAGTGSYGYHGDEIPAKETSFLDPFGLAGSADGSLYVADSNNHRVRMIDPGGIIHTVAGTGEPGFSGDGGPAVLARLSQPVDICLGIDTSLFIADLMNYRIRRVAPDGTIRTVAGTGAAGFSGDSGPAPSASVDEVWGVACGPDGSVYVADSGNHRVRVIDRNGIIRSFAGNGRMGYSGDGGPAGAAELNSPQALFVATDGAVWIGDEHNNRIRRVGTDGIITTMAGSGVAGFGGDGGPATDAMLNDPEGIWVYPSNSFLIADGDNDRIRLVETDGTIRTVIGGGRPTLPEWPPG